MFFRNQIQQDEKAHILALGVLAGFFLVRNLIEPNVELDPQTAGTTNTIFILGGASLLLNYFTFGDNQAYTYLKGVVIGALFYSSISSHTDYLALRPSQSGM